MKRYFPVFWCKLTAISLIIVANCTAQTTTTYTLQQCVDVALKNNINVKQRELNLNTAQTDQFQSKMALLPSLNGQVTHNYNTGFAINPITNASQRDVTFRSNNFGLNSSMTLFNGFQNINNIRLQKANTQAAQLDVAAAKNNLALQVANAYMQVLLNTEIVNARSEQAAATREQMLRQQKLYEYGSVNRVKYLQIKAQYATEESQHVTAQTQLDQSYLTLWQLMNIAPDSNNKIMRPDSSQLAVEGVSQSAEQIYAEFLARSPEVQAAKKRAEAAHMSYNMAAGGRSPRLTLNAGMSSFYSTQNQRGVGSGSITPQQIGIDSTGIPVYTFFNSYSSTEIVPFGDQFDRNLGKLVGFTLTVPILNGWQVNSNIQKQRINRASSELNQKQSELDLYKNVNQAYLDFKSTQKRYDASRDNYDANKEALALAESQFNLGALNAADFITSKNLYLQAETSMLQAKYELLFRRKVIDFYLGKSLY
jgi:outer membrane protein